MVDLMVSVLDSPYANYLIRQFVLTALTKLSGRPMTSAEQQQRISSLLDSYASSLELEIQQRAVEFENLLQLGDIKFGVLERMPPPELKATVLGIGKCCKVLYNRFGTYGVCAFSCGEERGRFDGIKGSELATRLFRWTD